MKPCKKVLCVLFPPFNEKGWTLLCPPFLFFSSPFNPLSAPAAVLPPCGED